MQKAIIIAEASESWREERSRVIRAGVEKDRALKLGRAPAQIGSCSLTLIDHSQIHGLSACCVDDAAMRSALTRCRLEGGWPSSRALVRSCALLLLLTIGAARMCRYTGAKRETMHRELGVDCTVVQMPNSGVETLSPADFEWRCTKSFDQT